ncbi:MAG: protein translocase subunit SecD [Bosea sp. (in: a-proteobacteria)]
MLRFSFWKTLVVVLLALGAVLYTAPNLWNEATRKAVEAGVPGFLPKAIVPHKAMPLGLDLQGGIHILLEVDTADVIRGQVNILRDDVRRVLREQRVVVPGGVSLITRGVQMRVADSADRAKLAPELRKLAVPIGNQLVGTQAGQSLTITEQPDGLIQMVVSDAAVQEKTRRTVEQSIEVIRRRIDPEGVKEPNIQRQGADRILVQIPGEQDPERLERILGTTAKLQFRMLAEAATASTDTEMLRSRETSGEAQVSVERRVIVEGDDLTDAQASFDQRTSEPIVSFRFNIKGAQRFGQVTTENVGRSLAIVLDNEVISAPRIQTPITGGSGQISGRFTVQAANDLAVLLRAGALPARMTIVERRTVGPGLGQDSIDAGKKASIVAAILVAGFMLVSYGLFGIFANIALGIHILLILAMMSLLGATMTLPGIAGIVLTIGTAVDANVLIYERIREEFRAGRSLISSLEAGFNRAFATIMDSNVTMFIAAVLLYIFGSGPVRGFAVTMIFGIITTIITAVTMTRMMIALWYKFGKPKTLPI